VGVPTRLPGAPLRKDAANASFTQTGRREPQPGGVLDEAGIVVVVVAGLPEGGSVSTLGVAVDGG